jgi:phosphoribosylformylglycinamidine cyclo-ligase
VPPVFTFLSEKGNIPMDEMYRTFNMGIGLMAIVEEAIADDVVHHFGALGEQASIIGEIVATDNGGQDQVELIN